MIPKISAGTIIASLLALAPTAGAAPFARYDEFPSVIAILANRDSSITAPKATLVNHGGGVHVIDGANMEDFFGIFLTLTKGQRLQFLKDGKWPDAAWEQFNADWCNKLIDAITLTDLSSAISSVPGKAFRKIPLSAVDNILYRLYWHVGDLSRQSSYSLDAQGAFKQGWFSSNYPTKDLMGMKAADYMPLKKKLSECGSRCNDLTKYLGSRWSDAVVQIADQMPVSDLTANLPLLNTSSKETDVMKKWMASPNSKAAIEKLTPVELTALLKVVPNDYKSKILDIWMASANQRTAMTPSEAKDVMASVPDGSKPAVLDAWMKAAGSQQQ